MLSSSHSVCVFSSSRQSIMRLRGRRGPRSSPDEDVPSVAAGNDASSGARYAKLNSSHGVVLICGARLGDEGVAHAVYATTLLVSLIT